MNAESGHSLTELEQRIDARMTELADPQYTGDRQRRAVELADLLAEYDRKAAAYRRRLDRAASSLRRVLATQPDLADGVAIRAWIGRGALSLVDRGHVEVVDAVESVSEPENGTSTSFLVHLAGDPIARLSVDGPISADEAALLATYTALVSMVLATAGLRRRDEHASQFVVGRTPRTEPSGADQPDLTARELEVLTHVVAGAANQEIADHLYISVETVRSHVKRILRKFGVANRAELIAVYGG